MYSNSNTEDKMQIVQRVLRKIIVIDDSGVVTADGKVLPKQEAQRIINEALKTVDGVVRKMFLLSSKINNASS